MAKDESRRIRATDLYRLEQINDLDISPDGQHVVYAVQRVDRKTEKKYSNLWIVPTDGGKPRQFTVGDQVDSSPRWSPDGSKIAFLSNRQDEKQPQLYVIPVDGGEARALTNLKGQFNGPTWSPDGQTLAFRFRKKDKKDIEREEDEQKKKLGIVYHHFDRVRYSLDGAGYFPKERWHLWTIDVDSGKAQQLTDSPVFDESAPCWSPDGEWLVFTSNHTPEPDLAPDEVDLFVMPAKGSGARKIETPLGPKRLPSVSPDNKWIAYIGSEGKGNWWKNDRLWIVPFDGSGPARCLTADHDVTVSAFTLNDTGDGVQVPPLWAPDGKTLYVQVSHHGSTTLHAVSVTGEDFQPIIEAPGMVSGPRLAADDTRLAYRHVRMADPGQLWARDMQTGESRQLTHINEKLLAKLDLGTLEEVGFEGPDGNDLQGWILKPPNFDPDKQYPSILEIHGGPLAQYGNAFMHEFYYLAAHDYVVYFCNPRGGIGYGEEHARGIWGAWGTVDYADLMAWTDYVAAQSYIDTGRMGVTGGSYGGYMTAWIIGHTDRFEAAVAQRSVTNLISMWGSSDANWIFQQPFGDRAPYESIDQLWASSPMKHISSATTPTLVIHSANDLRCPLEQGQQLFVALKTLGVETEFVVFPEEPHGLSRIGRTDRRVARLRHIRRWFDRYLK